MAGSAYLNIGTKLQLVEPDDVAEDDSDAIAQGGPRFVVGVLLRVVDSPLAGVGVRTTTTNHMQTNCSTSNCITVLSDASRAVDPFDCFPLSIKRHI